MVERRDGPNGLRGDDDDDICKAPDGHNLWATSCMISWCGA